MNQSNSWVAIGIWLIALYLFTGSLQSHYDAEQLIAELHQLNETLVKLIPLEGEK